MKTLLIALIVFVGITLPSQAQTISLNLLVTSVDTAPVEVEPMKVFTLEPGTIVRDYTLITTDSAAQPVAHKARTVITATATARVNDYAMGVRAQPVRRLFGRLFQGRVGRLGCSY